MSEKVNEKLERILNGEESDEFEFYSFVDEPLRKPIPTTDEFYDPSLKNTNIESKRIHEIAIMSPEYYEEYVASPFVENVPERCIGKENGKQVAWADMANEMMSSARLLPSYKEKCVPSDASKIIRTKFLRLQIQQSPSVWWFNGKFRKDFTTFQIAIKEIDVSGYVAANNVLADFQQFSSDQRYNGCLKLMKELYILHYFKHENLQHAYFTQSEPSLYRMNIALPLTIRMLSLSFSLKLRYKCENCITVPYVAICILRAVAYLHQCNIVHKNIWIQNCFMDADGNILLGGFENVDICRKGDEHLFLNDIWNVGITILDFAFQTFEYHMEFPDPMWIHGYDSLFDKILALHNRNIEFEKNSPNEPGIRSAYVRYGYIAALISRQSELFKFLDCILHPGDCPSADYLLRHHPYTAITEEEFRELRRQLIKKYHDEDESSELKIAPFCQEQKGSSLLQIFNPCNLSNPLKFKQRPLRGDIPDSTYQCKVKNLIRHFPDGATFYVTFSMYSDLQDEPVIYHGKIVIGAEHTFFKLFCDFTAIFNEKLAIEHGKRKNMQWNLLNSPGQFMLPWDVFRCRTALQSLLSEAANSVGDFKIARGGQLIAQRTFTLCNHPEKVSRRVKIVIKNFS